MDLKDVLLEAVRNDPAHVRKVFSDASVARALGGIGVGRMDGIEVFELHAPSEGARKTAGLGATRCGRNGIRHQMVTCKQCEKMRGKC